MPSEEREPHICPKCGGEMMPCIEKDTDSLFKRVSEATYHETGWWHCGKCGHEEKVR